MERADFLDLLITKYSFDEVYEVYELCINYYTSITGYELAPNVKDNLQNTIYLRPPISKIRDDIDMLISLFKQNLE